MTTSTSDSDLQLLTLNMVSTCSRTPSALRHSKRSNILAKDVNRNIQKLKMEKMTRERGKKDSQSKVFFFTRATAETTTTTIQIWLFSAALQVNFLLAFAFASANAQQVGSLAHWQHSPSPGWHFNFKYFVICDKCPKELRGTQALAESQLCPCSCCTTLALTLSSAPSLFLSKNNCNRFNRCHCLPNEIILFEFIRCFPQFFNWFHFLTNVGQQWKGGDVNLQ